MSTMRLRSRYAGYRWRNVRFENHVAVVDRETFAAAQRDPSFGAGADFWHDEVPEVQAAEPAGELDGMTKAELLELARERGVEVGPKATKAELLELLGTA